MDAEFVHSPELRHLLDAALAVRANSIGGPAVALQADVQCSGGDAAAALGLSRPEAEVFVLVGNRNGRGFRAERSGVSPRAVFAATACARRDDCYVLENVLFKISYPAELQARAAMEAVIKSHAEMVARGKVAVDNRS